ncbi:galactose-3-O-sulfotransferase 2-like [Spea bombifrons]|uniref:galactose-3-O-sulfotransferase 2-like n=1 Tax=Spea bombifrons TaxID=233779 RepID=UPI00234BF7FA|nr:galactose-3-O-sulfotransferase 2-like [Spea bombifrons]
MNILFRFGEYRNLTFAFPTYQQAQFFYPSYFQSTYVEGFSKDSKKTFHIMCHHLRFQLSEVEKVMDNHTFYFTILRNPVSLMESSFAYYTAMDIFSKARSLEDFINNSSYFYKSTSESSHYAKNLMVYDLGFDHNGPESAKHFKIMQQTVETMFDLVLISEYFDESLVLLKDALCWTFDDVLSFPLNSRKNTTKVVLSSETQEKIKNWNQYDWQLYVYFNRSFWNRVETFGRQKMQQEVEELRTRRDQMSQVCLQDEVDPDQMRDKSLTPFQAGRARIVGYNLNPNLNKTYQHLCQRLITPELQFSELLYRKQMNKTLLSRNNNPHKNRKTNFKLSQNRLKKI